MKAFCSRILWKELLSHGIFLYLLLALGFFFFIDHKAVIRSAQLQTLSRLTPSFNYAEKITSRPQQPDHKALIDCRFYHRQVVELVPPVASEAWGAAAFCSYGLGREQEAIKSLEKAQKGNAVFFWTHYNLGVAWMNKGDYQKAGDAFMRAMRVNPKYTLMILRSSKVYNDIFSSMGRRYDLEGSLRDGYQQSAAYLQVAMMCFRDPQASACQRRGRLSMKIF